jgi:4-hydroxybenzoate polyprenyltransferase
MLAWLQLLRIAGVFTLAGNAIVVLTAMMVWQTALHWQPISVLHDMLARIPFLAGISLCVYGCGMVWNDLADLERDRTLAPTRPLPRGAIRVRDAALLGIILPTVALMLAAATGPIVVVMTVLLLLFIAAYDFAGNKIPVLGPVLMGMIRGTHAVLWMTAADPTTPQRLLSGIRGYQWSEPIVHYAVLLMLTIACITWLSELESRRGRRLELVLLGIIWILFTVTAATSALSGAWFVQLFATGGYLLSTAWIAIVLASTAFALVWPGRAWLKVLRSARRRHVGPVVGACFAALLVLDGLWASTWHPLAGVAIWASIPFFLLASRFMRMT